MNKNLSLIASALLLAVNLQLVAEEAVATTQQDESAELAKKLQNPVANLISVPVQNNWDFGISPANAMKYTANIQPVIPFSISSGMKVYGEASGSSKVEGRAKATAKEIADVLKKRFQQQGWIN